MANLWTRKRLYRLEQIAGASPTFVLAATVDKDIPFTDIKEITPVNVLGGPDIGGFGFLYSKVTLKQPGLNQELYALQTVLQWQTEQNS